MTWDGLKRFRDRGAATLGSADGGIDHRYLAADIIELFNERNMLDIAIAEKKEAVIAKNNIVIPRQRRPRWPRSFLQAGKGRPLLWKGAAGCEQNSFQWRIQALRSAYHSLPAALIRSGLL